MVGIYQNNNTHAERQRELFAVQANMWLRHDRKQKQKLHWLRWLTLAQWYLSQTVLSTITTTEIEHVASFNHFIAAFIHKIKAIFLIEQTITLFVYIELKFFFLCFLYTFLKIYIIFRTLCSANSRINRTYIFFSLPSYDVNDTILFIQHLHFIPWTDYIHNIRLLFCFYWINVLHIIRTPSEIVLVSEEIEIWSMMLIIWFFLIACPFSWS